VLKSWLWESEDTHLTVEYHASLSRTYEEFYDYDLEEYRFGSVEEEIESVKHRDYMKNFKPVYEEIVESPKPVLITLIGSFEDTGSDYIQTPFQQGLARFVGGSGVYKVLISSVAANAVAKYIQANPDLKITNSDHSNIRFLQLDGKYIFTDSQEQHFQKCGLCRVVQTLSEAEKVEQDIRTKVTRLLELHCQPTTATAPQLKDFVEVLTSIQRSLVSLETKQKSDSEYRALCGKLLKEIEKYTGV
jgi:hypothetical protein